MTFRPTGPGITDKVMTVNAVTVDFGGVRALDDVSFEVPPGQLTSIIGPNGAGKTTLFNCMTGIYRPTL